MAPTFRARVSTCSPSRRRKRTDEESRNGDTVADFLEGVSGGAERRRSDVLACVDVHDNADDLDSG